MDDRKAYRLSTGVWRRCATRLARTMYLCLPTAATDDHFRQCATLIRTLMPAPRHIYVEYSTKTWDFSGTP